MYVATIPNRGSPPAILLRESYREAGKTKIRTLANLSDWPSERIELFRAVLRGDKLAPVGHHGFEIRRSLPHGPVLAALTVTQRHGPGSHRRQAARSVRQAGHRADARHRHRQPLAGRNPRPWPRHGARDLHH